MWIFRKSVEKIQVSLKSDKNKEYFTRRQKSLFIISRSFLLIMRNVSDKTCRENQNTHVVFSTFLENRAVYAKMWKNIVERGRPRMTIRRMCIACWIPKATNTHTRRLCNTQCFSASTMVARTRLSVTLRVRYSITQISVNTTNKLTTIIFIVYSYMFRLT